MSAAEKWTPEHLRSPVDRAIHLEQRRAQLLPIVDDLRRLAREMEAEMKEIESIEGDLPGQDRIRAWHVAKPLFRAADDAEKAISDLISFNGRFQKSYEDLPAKREKKRAQKALAKGQQPQAIESPQAEADPGPPEKSQFGDVFDGLRRGADPVTAQTKEERQAANRLAHFEKRQAERAPRGPRGLAESWMERARAVAVAREKAARAAGEDPEAVWHDLARTVSTWVSRYEE